MESVNKYHKSNELIKKMSHLMADLGINKRSILMNFKMGGKGKHSSTVKCSQVSAEQRFGQNQFS